MLSGHSAIDDSVVGAGVASPSSISVTEVIFVKGFAVVLYLAIVTGRPRLVEATGAAGLVPSVVVWEDPAFTTAGVLVVNRNHVFFIGSSVPLESSMSTP